MAWYRKTTPSSYPNTPTSNFTDTSKNWRQYKNMYRYTSGYETASLTAVPGRYTDNTRTWRRIKAIYRYKANGTWQKVFGKFAGQPYPEISPAIRYNSYDGVDVGNFAMMGPGSESIAQGSTSTTYLWGKDGQNWQNIENIANRTRTFVHGTTPLSSNATEVLNDEGFNEGDKLRNTQAYIEQYDGEYLWYRDRITLTNGSTGTAYSQTVRIIKQQPVINSLSFKTNNTISAGSTKYITYSVKNEWYRSVDQSNSRLDWYILDTQYETPTTAKLYGSTTIFGTSPTETTTTLTGEDYFNIPETFGGVSTTGKWLYVKIILKNSSSNTDVSYMSAPYSDVTDYIVAQITGAVPTGTNATVTMTRTNTSYEVKVESGNTGTWTGSPTSYRYQWYLQEQTVGSAYTWSPISGATSSTYNAVLYKPSDTSTTNRIVPVVWASNANGESNNGYALTNSGGVGIPSTLGGITVLNPTSNTTAMIKYKLPVITTFTVTGGTKKISYVTNFSSDDPSAIPSVSYSGAATGSFTPSSSSSSVDYSLTTTGTYNFTLTVSNASTNALSGSVTATQNSISVTGPATYDFNFGNTIYQGTNGYSSLDEGAYKLFPQNTTKRVINIYGQDLTQGISDTGTGSGYLLYWSNADEYVLQWTGFRTGFTSTASYQLRYQIRFYKDQEYADIKYIIKGSSLTSSYGPGMYYDGQPLGSLYTGAINQGTTVRVYFDGSTPLAGIAFTEVPNSAFVSAGGVTSGRETIPNADDSWTTLVSATNQFTAPTISIASISAATTSLSVDVTTGGSFSYYAYNLRTGSHTGTSVSSSTNETSDPLSITGLTADTTYYLTITPYNGMGQAGTAVQDSKATPAAIPSTPTSVTATADDEDSITIDWDDMSGAATYEVYYTTNVNNIPTSSTNATVNGLTSSTHQITSASSNTTYYVFVRARNATGVSAYSGQTSAKTAPAIPTNFAATASSSSAISLSWTNVTGASASNGYEIYRSTTTTAPGFSTAATITDSGTPYSDTGLSASTTYYYWIRSTNGTTKSNWSARVNATTNSAVSAPVNSAAPSVTRDSASTYKYNTTDGTWSGSPTYTYQWYYYRTFPYFPYSETTTISGATSSSYTSSSSYVGYYIYCTVTATNTGGNNNATSNFVQITTATVANVGNNKPQGAPVIVYDSANSTSTQWAYDVTITKSTTGVPDPSYYLQWFGSANSNNYTQQTGPYTSAGLGGSFTVQNVLVTKSGYTLYGCQAWATNGITGQDISNTAMSNSA